VAGTDCETTVCHGNVSQDSTRRSYADPPPTFRGCNGHGVPKGDDPPSLPPGGPSPRPLGAPSGRQGGTCRRTGPVELASELVQAVVTGRLRHVSEAMDASCRALSPSRKASEALTMEGQPRGGPNTSPPRRRADLTTPVPSVGLHLPWRSDLRRAVRKPCARMASTWPFRSPPLPSKARQLGLSGGACSGVGSSRRGCMPWSAKS